MQASNCLFQAFHVSTHFLHHIFSKMLFLLERGTHFCKTTSSDCNQKLYFFDPQTASIGAFFVILQKKIASAEQEAIKLSATGIDTNLHQKCKLQAANFMPFMFQLTFCSTFFQKCCSCSSGDNIFAKRLQAILIKIFIFLTPKRPR